MKRHLILMLVVIAASTTVNRAARAQVTGSILDMSAEIESQRKEARSKLKGGSAIAPPSSAARSSSADPYGRMDMAGHQPPSYPLLRSNAAGETPAYMARGAYNPNRRRAATGAAAASRPAGTAAARRTTASGTSPAVSLGGPPPLPTSGSSKAAASKSPIRSRRSSTAKSASGPPPLPF
ncbi:hypothetical protein [Aquisphaera insulae]|uniref:hypothetical protein n=1 Tax=Aquisphaera insulae TaxID=2712864 RepID=UPI0013E9DFF9|nr:hypothetical protein [Aquisphaera insulae]